MKDNPTQPNTPLPMPRDGGSYRREADGSLTCLQPPTGYPTAPHPITQTDPDAVETLDLEAQIHDGGATALPPIETAPRRKSGPRKE